MGRSGNGRPMPGNRRSDGGRSPYAKPGRDGGGYRERRAPRDGEWDQSRGGDRPGNRFGERSGDRPGYRFKERSGERFGDRPKERFGNRSRSFDRDQNAPARALKTNAQGLDVFAIATIGSATAVAPGMNGANRPSAPDPAFDEARPQRPDAAPEAAAATPPADDLIWGRHATQAALEAGRPIHRIWCTAEMRSASKFLQLLRDAKASGVLVEEVTWARLGQITGGSVHQGIALQTAAAETLDLDSLIEGCSDLGEPPCWWPWTVSPTPTTSGRLFAPLKPWEPMAW